jgi:hypothetical protein
MLTAGLVGITAFCVIAGVFIGHVCGFGLRTRNTQLHTAPRTRRDQRDRQWAGVWETHSSPGPAAGMPPPGTKEGSLCPKTLLEQEHWNQKHVSARVPDVPTLRWLEFPST